MTTKHKNIFHIATKYFLLLARDKVVACACTTARTEAEVGGGEHVMSCLMEQLSHDQHLQRGAHEGEYWPLIGPQTEY